MDVGNRKPTFEACCDFINSFSPCMHDYLYVYDLTGDAYYIAEPALSRFRLPACLFHDVVATLATFVYPDDTEMLASDLDLMLSGQKDEHNLEYRWLGLDGLPIWINCKGRLILSADGHQLMIGCINEIGNRSKADNISGLLGESSLREYMEQALPAIDDAMFLRIGIDDFKLINERHGTEYGNFVLREVAGCIVKCLSPSQSAYRIVSDEFMVADVSGVDYTEMNRLYHSIRSAVEDRKSVV